MNCVKCDRNLLFGHAPWCIVGWNERQAKRSTEFHDHRDYPEPSPQYRETSVDGRPLKEGS